MFLFNLVRQLQKIIHFAKQQTALLTWLYTMWLFSVYHIQNYIPKAQDACSLKVCRKTPSGIIIYL